eukprot:258621-Amphidinium_carterae.1
MFGAISVRIHVFVGPHTPVQQYVARHPTDMRACNRERWAALHGGLRKLRYLMLGFGPCPPGCGHLHDVHLAKHDGWVREGGSGRGWEHERVFCEPCDPWLPLSTRAKMLEYHKRAGK